MAIHYDRKQITEWLGSFTVGKARDYVDAVSDLHWRGNDTLVAKVQGTRSRPYDVWVMFNDAGDDMWIENECTCPVGFECKHVAALLIAGLAHLSQQTVTGVRPELVGWLDDFRAKRLAAPTGGKRAIARASHVLAYVIADGYQGSAQIMLYKARVASDGSIRSFEGAWYNVENALVKPPKFVTEQDLPILRGLWLERSRRLYGGQFGVQGATGAALLEKLIATGRTFASSGANAQHAGQLCLLRGGAERRGQFTWQTLPDTRMRPALQTEPAATMLMTATEPCWYLDVQTGEAGPVQLAWPAADVADLLSMPAITLDEAPLVGNVLREVTPGVPLPPAYDRSNVHAISAAPVPVLSLDTLPAMNPAWAPARVQNALDFATVSFDYEGERVPAQGNTILIRFGVHGELIHIQRDAASEKRRLMELRRAGLRVLPSEWARGPQPFPAGMLEPSDANDWPSFMKHTLPALREKGWLVEMTPSFRHNVIEIDAIEGSLRQTQDGWFDVEMGITVNGRRVRLEPLLADLFARDARWLSGQLGSISDDEAIELKTQSNERVRLPAARLKPVVRVLVDLLEHVGSGMQIAEWDAARLVALDDTGRWQFHGDASVRQLAQRLMAGPGVTEVPVPQGLQANLRGYQRQGLAWMQFLREHNLSGVLADDMGLGKTVQTLAHILAEKEAGRLGQPALIVVPTTLVHNWCEEAERFAPGLRVLNLHGAQRRARFNEIAEHDLVITTYALAWRDEEVLAQHAYHLLILDEAQYVKNAATKAAATIRALRATHRLTLTGTPLENHLGELWAQFDFLLPGFLGSRDDFGRRWRAPIEKGGDTVRRELLARRIRPFMLRRRKDEVATELPPKTTIVRAVELEGAQRDLYETVRATMRKKVRDAIAVNGLARSHLIVLDALLKLRQVCCDPRLLKTAQAKRVKDSAKLALLLEMLPELIEEGRRVLLFSQFTSMLDLIAAALDDVRIPYVVLTGETSDRAAPIRSFQQGEVPLFLISLKAGGVGLNLTAADTVIHYDPWWNPAVENQATDRAHRLGQDKPVFVYKLIAAGSVEEKIVAMQQQKAALASAILSDNATGASKFSADDFEALFAPIPDLPAPSTALKSRSQRRAGT